MTLPEEPTEPSLRNPLPTGDQPDTRRHDRARSRARRTMGRVIGWVTWRLELHGVFGFRLPLAGHVRRGRGEIPVLGVPLLLYATSRTAPSARTGRTS